MAELTVRLEEGVKAEAERPGGRGGEGIAPSRPARVRSAAICRLTSAGAGPPSRRILAALLWKCGAERRDLAANF
jgi:hypothetical protein